MIGNYVGSPWEFENLRSKDFEFFAEGCHFTDDSVCAAAVADILLNRRPPAATLQEWCRRYPHCRWGARFGYWIVDESRAPYGSYGNGAAMRVSPAAFLKRRCPLAAAFAASDRVTEVTHNHPEGMKGARATTDAVWRAFQGEKPERVRDSVAKEYGYNLARSVSEIRTTYEYNETRQQIVPESITCALESEGFEDAMRTRSRLAATPMGSRRSPVRSPRRSAGSRTIFARYAKSEIPKDAPDILAILEAMAEEERSAVGGE